MKVKDATRAAEKFVQRGSAAVGDYIAGAQGAGADWQAQTAASAESWGQGVQQAIVDNRFAKGVQAAGGARYEQRIAEVGKTRFPEGIRTAGPAWQRGATPFLDTLKSLALPPRAPRGDPRNRERVDVTNMALRKKKVGG